MKNFPEKNVVYILRPAITELQVWLWQKRLWRKLEITKTDIKFRISQELDSKSLQKS